MGTGVAHNDTQPGSSPGTATNSEEIMYKGFSIILALMLLGSAIAQASEVLQPQGSLWDILKMKPHKPGKVNCDVKNKLCDTQRPKRKEENNK